MNEIGINCNHGSVPSLRPVFKIPNTRIYDYEIRGRRRAGRGDDHIETSHSAGISYVYLPYVKGQRSITSKPGQRSSHERRRRGPALERHSSNAYRRFDSSCQIEVRGRGSEGKHRWAEKPTLAPCPRQDSSPRQGEKRQEIARSLLEPFTPVRPLN